MPMKRILLVASQETIDGVSCYGCHPGVELVPHPAIRFESVACRLPDPASYDWVFFGSRQGVSHLLSLVPDALKDKRVGAVGSRTGDALRAAGVTVDFVPESFSSITWPGEFAGKFPEARAVLYPTSDRSSFSQPDVFREAGIELLSVSVYRTVCTSSRVSGKMDAIIFGSPSCFDCFVDANGVESLAHAQLTAIGAVTERRIRKAGYDCIVPDRYTMDDAIRKTCAELKEKS